jgi:hypothetical protein
LAEFVIGKWAFQTFSPSYLVGVLPYVLSIIGKEMKTNFLPVRYIRTPSEQALIPKNTGQSQGRPVSGRMPHLDRITPL